jgi:hypothetical protein
MDNDAHLAGYILEDREMDEDEWEGELVEAAGVVFGVTLVIADQRRQRRAKRCQQTRQYFVHTESGISIIFGDLKE